MSNPTTMVPAAGAVPTPAVIVTGVVEVLLTLDPRREYTIAHDGETNGGVADSNNVYLATATGVTASSAEGANKAKLLPGRTIVVGPGVDTLALKTAAGAPTVTVVPGPDCLGMW